MDDLVDRACVLAEEVLSGTLPRRWRHVQGVLYKAELAGSLFREDADTLRAAAVLHDVGYSPAAVVSGFHALDGAGYLKKMGFPARICALVAHHSCAYREAELRGLSAELAQWVDEKTPLRDALWWADMTTSPDGAATNVGDRIDEIQKRYGPDDLVSFFVRQARPDLVAAVDRTEQRLRSAGIDYTAK